MGIKYLDQPEPTSGRIRYLDEEEPKSLAGFGHNLVEDVKETGTGLGHLAEGAIKRPIETAVSVAKNIVPGLIAEGKRLGVGELLTGHPVNAIEKLGEAAYNKPLTTAFSVVPAVGAVGKLAGAGMKALRGAELGLAGEEAAATAAQAAAKEAPGALAEDLVAIPKGTAGKSATMEAAEEFARNPPKPPPAAPPPKPPIDPLKEVSDYVTAKYGAAAAKPGFVQKAGDWLSNFASDVRGKDIGFRPGQIQSMGQGFKGLEKAEELLDYADSKGYFTPTMTDAARKAKIKSVLDETGKMIGGIREVADKRGAPPLQQILETAKTQLTKEFGTDAPAEVQKVLSKIEQRMKENPTFSGMADLATELNKAKTPARSMGQHPGPTTEAANIVARMNNEATRGVLNAKESELFTSSLRDFGAHKKLEQAVSNAARRSMSGRSGQLGSLTNRLVQNVLDSGGYRIGGKIAGRLGKAMKSNPDRFKTLPQFFEELAHETGDVVDDVIYPGMAHGGIAGMPGLNDFLAAKYGKPKET